MKILTIGRSEDCDVVIDDAQDMVSRKHALLRIYPTGKMELVPCGRNGTYVNGLPVKNDKPKVVTRKDVISFAHVRQLDWSIVPDPYRMHRYGILVCTVACIGILCYCMFNDKLGGSPVNTSIQQVVGADDPAKPAAQDTSKKDTTKVNAKAGAADAILEQFEQDQQKTEEERQQAEQNGKKGKGKKGAAKQEPTNKEDTSANKDGKKNRIL